MKYYIIEHPTRGIVKDWDYDPDFVVRWSRAEMRSDERNMRFTSVQAADELMRKMRYSIKKDCTVRRSTDWEIVARG